MLGARPMTRDRERLVLGLVPPVLAAVTLPGLNLDRVVGEGRERRYAVLAVVLVLVVAPEQNEVGLERIQLGPRLAEVVDQIVPVRLGVGRALVGGPLRAHRWMPRLGCAQILGQQRIGYQQLDAAGHVALVREGRVVRDAEPENLSHAVLLSQRAES